MTPRQFPLIPACFLTLALAPAFATPIPIIEPEVHEVDTTESDKAAERLFQRQKDASRRNANTAARPDSPALRSAELSISRAARQLAVNEGLISAGVASGKESKLVLEDECVWFCKPSVFAEYSWLTSNDTRPLGFDGQTHTFSGGLSFSTIWDLAAGINYSYASQDLHSGATDSSTDSDSHFFGVYVAKSFMQFLYAGVALGYGHTDVESRVNSPAFYEGSDTDTFTVSPFVGLNYVRGAFFTNLNVAYIYTDSDSSSVGADSEDGKIVTALNVGYSITEQLSVAAVGKYTQMVHYDDAPAGFPEDRQWFTVGGKFAFRATEHIELNGGYEYDINDVYKNHTVTGGVTYTF